jgi:hypothetical protein
MAKVLAGTYRFVRETDKKGDNDEPLYERVVLKPGTPTKGLPKKVVEDLTKDKLVVDEKQLNKQGLRRGPESLAAALSEDESEEDSKDSDDTKKKTGASKT